MKTNMVCFAAHPDVKHYDTERLVVTLHSKLLQRE